MKLVNFISFYIFYIITLLSFPINIACAQSRFAKIENQYVVIYEVPPMQLSDKNTQTAIEIERFPREQNISYQTTDEAIGKMIEIGYKIRTVASFFLPYVERYSNLLGVGAPGLFSLQFGYTREYGFGLYYYPESQLGWSLYETFIQKYRLITGDTETIYLMNPGRYDLKKRRPLGF